MLELQCPHAVEEEWQEVVKSVVQPRVARLLPEYRVDLFCTLENKTNAPNLLTNIFMTEAATALDELILKASYSSSLLLYVIKLVVEVD